MSQWQDRDFVGKITQILEGVPQPDSASSGRTFVTVYQLAIMFANRYREDAEAVHKEVGGKTSIGNSLSAYLARNLSQQIGDNRISHIEMALLSFEHIEKVDFDGDVEPFSGRGNPRYEAFTLFRLR